MFRPRPSATITTASIRRPELRQPAGIRAEPRGIAPIESAGPLFAAACKDWDDYDKPAPPVRIFGNTYLVGTCGISAILITGAQGHILIDGGTEKGADLIAKNIQDLGFRLRDVKFILHSHEHFDHVGGIARLQQLTGAELLSSPAAAVVLNTGLAGEDDPQRGMSPPFPAAHVDRIGRLSEVDPIGRARDGHRSDLHDVVGGIAIAVKVGVSLVGLGHESGEPGIG